MLHTLRPQNSNQVSVKYYGIAGELKEDGPYALAKAVTTNGKTQYFCKFNTYGVEAGHMVNPWSMYADAGVSNFVNAENPRTGKQLQEYRAVNETVFQLYTSYLKSRSQVHYRQAERMALENVSY